MKALLSGGAGWVIMGLLGSSAVALWLFGNARYEDGREYERGLQAAANEQAEGVGDELVQDNKKADDAHKETTDAVQDTYEKTLTEVDLNAAYRRGITDGLDRGIRTVRANPPAVGSCLRIAYDNDDRLYLNGLSIQREVFKDSTGSVGAGDTAEVPALAGGYPVP